jgi:hypothetical protein
MAWIDLKETKNWRGIEIFDPTEIKKNDQLIVCAGQSCWIGKAMLSFVNEWPNPYLRLTLIYDEPQPGTTMQDQYFHEWKIVLQHLGDGEYRIVNNPVRIFRQAYGHSIANIAHAKNLAPNTASTIAEFLTGRRPTRNLPARIRIANAGIGSAAVANSQEKAVGGSSHKRKSSTRTRKQIKKTKTYKSKSKRRQV